MSRQEQHNQYMVEVKPLIGERQFLGGPEHAVPEQTARTWFKNHVKLGTAPKLYGRRVITYYGDWEEMEAFQDEDETVS